jgi:hypothetical protein
LNGKNENGTVRRPASRREQTQAQQHAADQGRQGATGRVCRVRAGSAGYLGTGNLPLTPSPTQPDATCTPPTPTRWANCYLDHDSGVAPST